MNSYREDAPVIDKLIFHLQEIRRDLTSDQKAIALPKINRLMFDLRSLKEGQSHEDRNQRVQHSVLRSEARTVDEVCGDTRLQRKDVLAALEALQITLPDMVTDTPKLSTIDRFRD